MERSILSLHPGYTWFKQIALFIYIIIASCLTLFVHYCGWGGHYTVIYRHQIFTFVLNSVCANSVCVDLHKGNRIRSCICTENTEGALRLSTESITHWAAYFEGSKDHTPLCAGACTKNVAVNEHLRLIRLKNKCRFEFPPKIILDTYIRNTPRGTKTGRIGCNFGSFLLQSDEIWDASPKWNESQKQMFWNSLKVICSSESAQNRGFIVKHTKRSLTNCLYRFSQRVVVRSNF